MEIEFIRKPNNNNDNKNNNKKLTKNRKKKITRLNASSLFFGFYSSHDTVFICFWIN